MALDDFVDPEVGAAVAATTIVLSSRARRWLHQGAVYGIAGVLTAGDALVSFGRGVQRGARRSPEPTNGPRARGAEATAPARETPAP